MGYVWCEICVGYVWCEICVGYVWREICVGYVWCEIRQQSSEEPCDETSFGRSVRHGGSLPCTSPCTLKLTSKAGANVSNLYEIEIPLVPGTYADFTRLQGHRITVVVCFAFSCSSHGCNMQIHQAVEQIEKVSVSSWLSEGERKRCRESYFGSNSHLLNTHAIFYIIGGK